MESVITLVIVLIAIIVQVMRAVREQRGHAGSKGAGGDGWWEETPAQPTPGRPLAVPAPAPRPAPRPAPSQHVQAILRQLQQQAQAVAAAPAPAPRPERHYLEEKDEEEHDEEQDKIIETELSAAARLATERAVEEIYGQSASTAFPATRKILKPRQAGQRAPIRLRARSRANLRQAILLGEVLGPPRAFDV